MNWRRHLAAGLLLFSALPAFGQGTVLQGGPWQPGHVPQYVGQGSSQPVVQDGGGAGGGAVGVNPAELGVTARGVGAAPYAGQGSGAFGTNICDYDAPINNPAGYHYLCLSANAQGGGLLAYGAGGTATPLPFNIVINGQFSSLPFPASTTTVTPEQFGYGCSQPGCIPYGTGDAGPAINAALNSQGFPGACVKVVFGSHDYHVITPIVGSSSCKWLAGQGFGSVLTYVPAVCNGTLITYHDPTISTSITLMRVTDLEIISFDHGCAKTAINIVDGSGVEISNVYFPIWSDTTHSSVCLQTNGREVSDFHDLRATGCDMPINLLANPNAGIDADHFHFWNLYLISAANRPAITATNMIFTNTTFDGYQAWVSGTYGFYYNATVSSGRGWGLSFYNVRTEQGTDPTAYSFYFNVTNQLAGLVIKNPFLDTGRLGIYARGILNLSVEQPYYSVVSPATGKFLDVDTSDTSVVVSNARFESGVTQSLGGLIPLYEIFTGAPIPTSAQYVTASTYMLFPSAITLSGPLNNVLFPAPASTAIATFASGTVSVFGVPNTLTGTSGAVGGTDSSVTVNASGSFTLTLPSASGNAGRIISLRSIAAQTVVSNSSNVVPLAGGAAGTALLAATAGKWATLQSDNTNWIITAAN